MASRRTHAATPPALVMLVALASPACGRVVVLEDEVSSSSADAAAGVGGGDHGGPGVVVAGTGGGTPGSGAGGAPGSGGAPGGGGAPGVDPSSACVALTWTHEPDAQLQQVDSWDRWARGDGSRLRHGDAGEVAAVFSGRKRGSGDQPLRVRAATTATVADAWTGRPRLVVGTAESWWTERTTPWFVAAPAAGEHLWWLVVDSPYDLEAPGLWLAGYRVGPGSWKRTRMPNELSWLRDVAADPDSPGPVAFVSGVDRLRLWTAPGSLDEPVAVDFEACGDRELAVDLESVGGRHLLAYASAADSSCGSPVRAEIAVLEDGVATAVDGIDLGAPVRSLHLAVAGDTTWLVARTEGSDTSSVLRLSSAGTIEHRADVPLDAGRELAVASWSTGVVLVDTGADDGSTPWIRARALDGDGALVATSEPPAWSFVPEGLVSALGAPGDDAVLVTFMDHDPEGLLRHGVLRADCVAGPAR